MHVDMVSDSFSQFCQYLDDYNDRRELLIKASRDITNLSKKIIFLLHRTVSEGTDPYHTRATKAAKAARPKLQEVQDIFATLKPHLEGDLYWRHARQVSPGLQEYIEALSFAYYLENDGLIPFDAVQNTLIDKEGTTLFPLTPSDYLLGVSDLTGELMRFAINALSQPGGRLKATDVCRFVRDCKSDFERFTPFVYDLRKKQNVTSQSLEKIENAAYAIVLRTSEYDLPPDKLDDLVASVTAQYSKRSEEVYDE